MYILKNDERWDGRESLRTKYEENKEVFSMLCNISNFGGYKNLKKKREESNKFSFFKFGFQIPIKRLYAKLNYNPTILYFIFGITRALDSEIF